MFIKTKFRVQAIQIVPTPTGEARFLLLNPVKDDLFGPSVPQGELKMVIHPEAAYSQFRIGQEIDVTFSVDEGISAIECVGTSQ